MGRPAKSFISFYVQEAYLMLLFPYKGLQYIMWMGGGGGGSEYVKLLY
jgi:hypothetical protein